MSVWKEETHGFNFFVVRGWFVKSIVLIWLNSVRYCPQNKQMKNSFNLPAIDVPLVENWSKNVLAHCLPSFSFFFPVGTETQTRKKSQNENCGVCRKSCWSWWQRCKLDLQVKLFHSWIIINYNKTQVNSGLPLSGQKLVGKNILR